MCRKKWGTDSFLRAADCSLLAGEWGTTFHVLPSPESELTQVGIQKGVVYEMIRSESGIPLATQENDPLEEITIDNAMDNTRALPLWLILNEHLLSSQWTLRSHNPPRCHGGEWKQE